MNINRRGKFALLLIAAFLIIQNFWSTRTFGWILIGVALGMMVESWITRKEIEEGTFKQLQERTKVAVEQTS